MATSLAPTPASAPTPTPPPFLTPGLVSALVQAHLTDSVGLANSLGPLMRAMSLLAHRQAQASMLTQAHRQQRQQQKQQQQQHQQ
ncbi:unnamed protein product [Protopolystoma xenopodis]|uniref:Uncharacterized protein n=1 Tax=Protopolystoma xenopodis TaxID=117903 RepID=A0A448X3V1_9PLAT|nr:unnamed protein product [Protopolystoma xenopodis]